MGMSLSQIKRIPSFWEWPPPPLGILRSQVYFFPLLHSLCQRLDSRQLTPKTSAGGARKIERRKCESLPEAQEIPRSGETNSQFLALNSCKAHTSSISCSYLVCDTDYLLLRVGKFFFHLTRTSFFFFFFPCGSSFFFPSMCGSSFFFFYLWVGQVFFFTKTSCSPPLEV